MATARVALRRTIRVWPWYGYTRGTLIALVSLVYAVVLALNMLTVLTPPRMMRVLGASATGAVRVAWVWPDSTLWDHGVRRGDRVLALDGRAPSPRDAGVWRGQRLVVRGARGVEAVAASELRSGHDPLPLLLLSPWFFLLGTLVVVRARQPRVGHDAYLFLVSGAYAMALAPAADADEPIAGVAEFAMVLLFAAFFVRFFLTFPRPRSARIRRAVLVAPLAVIALGVAGLAHPPLSDIASRLRLGVLLVYLLIGAGVLASACVKERERDPRRGLIIMGVGTVVSILPFALLYLAPTLLHRPALVSSEHAVFAFAILAASFSYAIPRHDVLDVSLLQRWLVHGLLWVAVFALCLAVAYVLRHVANVANGGPTGTLVVLAALVLLTGLAFRRPYDGLRRILDDRLFKDAYDYRAALQGLSRDLSLVGDLATLAAALPDRLQRLMNLDFAVLLAEGARRALSDQGPHGPCPVDLAAAARAVQGEPRAVSLADGETAVLVVPLRTHDRLVGHLCLGPKRSGEPFRSEDRALLSTLSGQLAALVRNAQLVDELRAQVGLLQAREATLDTLNERLQHAQEEERARLAADLHDEALQTALHLRRRLIADGQGRAAADGHVAVAEAVIDQLRLVCTTVRPPALDELGLAAALEALALDLGADLTVPILLDADPALTEFALSPDIELVIYRAAQEALNNALRHAHPATIRMTLRCDDGAVQLAVCDDGDGFVVPARLDTLAAAGHLGLVGLQRRVGHAGGLLSVTAAPGRGTVVRVAIPVAVMKGVPE